MNEPAHTQHINFLDGLRGLAIVLVVIFHYWQISWLDHTLRLPFASIDLNFIARSGFVGVELFFFLSGFCLFLPHARLLVDGKPLNSLNVFIYKRFIKIFPSYILSIFLVIWINDVEFVSALHFLKVLAAHVLFTTNHLTQFNLINGVFWSLAVEVQFYVLFPLVAYVFRKAPFLACLGLCACAFGFRCYYVVENPSHLVHALEYMPAALDLFACGMLGAYLTTKWKQVLTATPMLRILLALISFTSMVFFIELLQWYEDILRYSGNGKIWQAFHRLTMAICFLFVAIAGVFSWRLWVCIMANRCFVFLGLISYNLYIWHQIIAMYFYDHQLIPSSTVSQRDDVVWQMTFSVVVLCISLIVATLITFYFERPLMKHGLLKSPGIFWRRYINREALREA